MSEAIQITATGTPGPFVLVIFGASGDLTRRKLIPALFHLYREGLLPENFAIVGYARSELGDEGFRELIYQSIAEHARETGDEDESRRRFNSTVRYQQGRYDDERDIRRLAGRLQAITSELNIPANYLFYLSTPPEMIAPIAEQLARVQLNHRGPNPWSRLVVEKPFGRDLTSAKELNQILQQSFAEEQIFRIDHYLGKETVQNLLVLRLANSVFEPLWNNRYIDHVQITAAETLGVEGRAGYYEQAGALRDMVQNHLMHLLSLAAMEPPVALMADAIRDEKVKVLRSLRPIPARCAMNGVVRAQYGPGEQKGQSAKGYLQEDGVATDSTTETFVAFKAMIDNWRWAGVPFYLRTGKRMPVRITEIGIHFRSAPQVLFNAKGELPANFLAIRIQPNEGIAMQLQVKRPGLTQAIEPFLMDFGYADAFKQRLSDAYERLLLDAARGDTTLFTRADEVEAAWAYVDPIIQGCEGKGTLPQYPAGSWGPREADALIEDEGRRWQLIKRKKQ
ncbi:MAG: glucose-6-phosphate dehydrogenase [Sedimentisphaerales bacterium]|nr:glucose-6-phosphate dehydrogenase [Sedimentisphaerales bacterium]